MRLGHNVQAMCVVSWIDNVSGTDCLVLCTSVVLG